jgi:hypothetical protein
LVFGLRQEAISGVINVNFGGSSNPTYTGAAVIGSSGDIWNQASGTPTNLSLLDSGGNNTSVTFTNSNGFAITDNYGFGFSGTQYANLMQGYLVLLNPSVFTIGGLNPSNSYDLYIYSQGDSGSSGRRLKVTVGGTVFGTTATNANASTFILGQNYLKLSGLTPNSSGNIVGTWEKLAGEGNVNGFQLTEASGNAAVPEPASIVIFGLGALGMAYRTRRKVIA